MKAKIRDDRQEAVGPNDVWAMDFVHDRLATGTNIRILTVEDTFSRHAPATDPRFSYRGEDVVQTLEGSARSSANPRRSGWTLAEFISRDLDLPVILDLSRPGKPTDNAYIKSFNGKFRAECLNQH